MSDLSSTPVGVIGWTDLTIPDAADIRDFYAAVVGWIPSAVEMGGYADFNMNGADGRPVVGICHARGPNADLPPVWLVYIRVADLDRSLAECDRRGGSVIASPKAFGATARYAVIQDPAGAIAALYEDSSRPRTDRERVP